MKPASDSIALNYSRPLQTTVTEVEGIRGPTPVRYAGHEMCPKRIAIVDDMPRVRESYLLTLKARGHEVALAAESGEEIVRAAREGKLENIDVIIMDYSMGEINGLQAAGIVNEYYPRIKIIIASGEDEIVNEVNISGLAYLRKPFSRFDLLESVE
jgi:DNA-binding NtrC family response regulator